MSSKITVKLRSDKGSLSVLIPIFVVLALIGIGAFGMDISHNVTVRSELQNATDASALAGAQSIIDPNTEKNAFNDALAVAGNNTADGKSVSNSNTSFSVVPSQGVWDNTTNSNTFTVNATKSIKNTFAKLFKHNSDTVRAKSTARAWRSVTAVGNDLLFPLAVSIDTMNGHSIPLFKNHIGDAITFDINSQQYKNAAFTTFNIKNTNANTLTKIIDQQLGFSPKDGGIPGLQLGDDLNLTNGVAEQKQLAKGDYVSQMTDPNRTFLIPVMAGEPPYNQSRKLVGFLGIKIKSIEINGKGGQVEKFNATLVKYIVKGQGGVPHGTGDSDKDNGIKDLSAGTFKLES